MIESARLILRLPEHDDVPEVVRFYTENRDHLEPWAPLSPPGFLTAEYWDGQVELRRTELREGTGARLFIFPRDRPQRVIGNLSLTQVVRGPLQSCVLGYALAAGEQGRGYMVEAVRVPGRGVLAVLPAHPGAVGGPRQHGDRQPAVVRAGGGAGPR